MSATKTYPKSYIENCREKIEGDLQAYRLQVGNSLDEDFSVRFFNNQVLVMNAMFVDRDADVEGEDGNPLKEVRAISNSLLFNGGKFQPERQPGWPDAAGPSVKLTAELSVLGLTQGEEIKLDESDFMRLSEAFFAEVEKRYLE